MDSYNAAVRNTEPFDTGVSINMLQIEKTSNVVVPLQNTPYSKRDHLPPRSTINESCERSASLYRTCEFCGNETHNICRPCYNSKIRELCLSQYVGSKHPRSGFLESQQDDKTTGKTHPKEGCVQIKTDGKNTNSLNTSERTCRRPCPRCNLETIVGRKHLNRMASGLHVTCCQCKMDWCFTCESPWHPGAACNETCCNSWSYEAKTEHPGPEFLEDSRECNNMRAKSESFHYGDLQQNPDSRSKKSSTDIPDNDIQSLSVKYINRVEEETSVILNIGKTCDICFSISTDDIRPCCQLLICPDCIRTYLTLKISKGVTDITCPNHGCNYIMSEAEISKSVDGTNFLKYQQFVVNAKGDPYRKTCPRCSYITVIDTSNGSIDGLRISCPGCDLCWCFNCQVPWHRNMTCSEYHSGDDEIFKKWVLDYSSGQINAQKCPKCQVYIQRNGGCNHIKCTQCRTDFCYQCGKKGFNHGHDETRNNFNVGANNHYEARNNLNVGANYQTRQRTIRSRIIRCMQRGFIAVLVLIFCVGPMVWWIPLVIISAISGRNNTTSTNDTN